MTMSWDPGNQSILGRLGLGGSLQSSQYIQGAPKSSDEQGGYYNNTGLTSDPGFEVGGVQQTPSNPNDVYLGGQVVPQSRLPVSFQPPGTIMQDTNLNDLLGMKVGNTMNAVTPLRQNLPQFDANLRDMGVRPGARPGMNAVQDARMQGGYQNTDPRQAVLAAYNNPGQPVQQQSYQPHSGFTPSYQPPTQAAPTNTASSIGWSGQETADGLRKDIADWQSGALAQAPDQAATLAAFQQRLADLQSGKPMTAGRTYTSGSQTGQFVPNGGGIGGS